MAAAKAGAVALAAAKAVRQGEASGTVAARARSAPGTALGLAYLHVDDESGSSSEEEVGKSKTAFAGMLAREQLRLSSQQHARKRAVQEVHASANFLLSTSASSNVLEIQELTAPALAALATTDATILSRHGSVKAILDMMKDQPNVSMPVLGARAVHVLSLLLLNPTNFSNLNNMDSYSDEILRGLCAYVEDKYAQHTSPSDASVAPASASQLSCEAALLIRRLTEAASVRGLSWECLRASWTPRPMPATASTQLHMKQGSDVDLRIQGRLGRLRVSLHRSACAHPGSHASHALRQRTSRSRRTECVTSSSSSRW